MEGAVAFTSVSVIAAHGVCIIAGLVMVVMSAMTVVIAMNEQTDAIVIVMMMILNHGA